MDAITKIAIFVTLGIFIFYLLGTMGNAQSKPRENSAPYVEYYRNK